MPIKVVTYSGRDADTMPPLWVARNADQGVAIGASIVSAATATEVGASGVRRQPWANEPFIPGPLADYMDAQFKFFNSGKLTRKRAAHLPGSTISSPGETAAEKARSSSARNGT